MPSLTSLGEFGLIERARQWLGGPDKRWKVGIGDDAAVLQWAPRHYQYFTEDLLIEGVHFRRGSKSDWQDLGWKSLAVNLSDLAAMGAKPLGAVVGLALPKKTKLSEVEALYRGLAEASAAYRCPIIGGDTNASPSGMTIAVALLGESGLPPLLRSGAKRGDSLWVSGELGAAGLGWIAAQGKLGGAFKVFRRRHARPIPRLEWGQKLAASRLVSSAMDLSDGLAGDLAHLAKASRLGFKIDIDRLPRARDFALLCGKAKTSEEALLLGGGEDYELLFTVRAGKEKLFEKFCRRQRIAATRIGEAVGGQKLLWQRFGKKVNPKWRGYRHF